MQSDDAAPAVRPLDAILLDYLAEARAGRVFAQRIEQAESQLPEWARPGRKFLDHHGNLTGAEVWWPMVPDPTPPSHPSAFRSIRPSLRESFEHHMVLAPRADDERAMSRRMRRNNRLAGFAAVRRRIKRFREQAAEHARVGLPDLLSQQDASANRLCELLEEMEAHTLGVSPCALSVFAILQFLNDCNTRDAIDIQSLPSMCAELLKRFTPDLTGILRIVAEDITSKRNSTFDDLLLAGANARIADDGARAHMEAA